MSIGQTVTTLHISTYKLCTLKLKIFEVSGIMPPLNNLGCKSQKNQIGLNGEISCHWKCRMECSLEVNIDPATQTWLALAFLFLPYLVQLWLHPPALQNGLSLCVGEECCHNSNHFHTVLTTNGEGPFLGSQRREESFIHGSLSKHLLSHWPWWHSVPSQNQSL